jgi:hypothetical protein
MSARSAWNQRNTGGHGPPLQSFDYCIDCDDFLLYELGRLIEEDRASFDDEEFRRVIEAGIHEHIERRIDVRAQMARRLRSVRGPKGLLHAIEDIESPLRDMPEIIQSYTAYIFERLDKCSEVPPDDRITTAADTLLESSADHAAAEASIDLLGAIRSAVSARVLAYVISEPMLDEDLEAKAYGHLRETWPLPRHFILYSIKPHTHEDLPLRWFQLLIECKEPSAVDRILEEVLVHSADANFREDLVALVQLLDQSHDPETEDKMLQVINSDSTPGSASRLLQEYLRNTKIQKRTATQVDSPWTALEQAYLANRRYRAAARLFDGGDQAAAARALDELLKEDSQYPFALMLRAML